MAAWLFSTCISHHDLLPHLPLDLSLHSQQQPLPWDFFTILKLQLPTAAPSWGPAFLSQVWMTVARTVWFSFHLGCHRSVVSLSALSVSLLTQTIASCGDQTPASVPPPPDGRSSPTTTPVFPTSSFVLLRFAWFSLYSFPLVRYSCLLSTGVLHVLLCLKVCSWCIHGERCTPHPPTPLPSCSSFNSTFLNRPGGYLGCSSSSAISRGAAEKNLVRKISCSCLSVHS